MGLTFLAAGTSVPEAVSSVIVTNQGHGAMGISSSISSNTFDILLCLALPWFIKSYFYPTIPGEYYVSLILKKTWPSLSGLVNEKLLVPGGKVSSARPKQTTETQNCNLISVDSIYRFNSIRLD